MSQAHEKLIAWQRADDLCVEIYRLTRQKLPPSERYELSKQLRRAAYSVPANLAEGFATESTAIRLRYARIAVGSLAEVGYGVHLAGRLNCLSGDVGQRALNQISMVAAPLRGLIKHLTEELATQKKG